MVRVFLLSLFLTAPFFAAAQTGSLCDLYQSGSAPPAGYGAAWNTLTAEKRLIITAVCHVDGAVSHWVGHGDNTHYVYKTGYYYDLSKWNPLTFEGLFAASSADWFAGVGKKVLSDPPAQDYFWVGYLCQWTGSQWKCGCRDSACTTNYWQLQQVKRQGSSSGGSTTAGSSGTCNASSWSGVPCPPEAPRSYSLPAGGTRVTNGSQLRDALSGSSARDIILANGTYDNSSPFNANAAHRLWAETLGGSTLTAGIIFDAGAGPEIHGVKFDVNSLAKVKNVRRDGAVVWTEGSAHKLRVTDSWFDGNGKIGSAIDTQAINGVVVQRVIISNFMSTGIFVDDHPADAVDANPRVIITDANISNIKHSDATCCNGQVEFGIRAGTTMTVERVKTRNTDWSGIVPIRNCSHCIFRDIDIDGTKSAAFYWEHFADNSLLERFVLGPNVETGINYESAQERWNWKPVGPNNVVQDGTIKSPEIGVNVPFGTDHTTIQRVKFIGQCGAGIAHSAVLPVGPLDGSAGNTNIFRNNDFSGMKPGTPQIIEKHPNAISC